MSFILTTSDGYTLAVHTETDAGPALVVIVETAPAEPDMEQSE